MKSAYDIVKISRDINRPTSRAFINAIFNDFIELHGDRYFADDKAIVGGICTFKGRPVTVIGVQKGNTLDENLESNFGQVKPEGYRKAIRLAKQAEKFNRPVIFFVNTPGAYCGVGAEERGQSEAIARNMYELGTLKVPVLSFMIGEGGSGGAIALAVADKVFMLENAIYSVLSPEGFASILWRDSKKSKEAAEFMKLTAKDLFELGVIDEIIKEHEDGIENNFKFTTDIISNYIQQELDRLYSLPIEKLLEDRYKRFRKFGQS